MHPARTSFAVVLPLGLVLAGALTGCSSQTAKQERVVRCTGFSAALLQSDVDKTLLDAGDALIAKDGITDQDTIPMGRAATSYAAHMDPARVTQLMDQGKADAAGLIAKKDAQAIADYTRSCVENYRSLTR